MSDLCASAPLRFIFVVLVVWLAGCERSPSPIASEGELRIVSLSPAISRTLVDFDLDDRIVGRTPFCASIDQSIPVVGSLLDVDYERLLKLEPSHVLVQPGLAAGVEPRLRELTKKHNWTLGEFPSLNTIDDVEAMILALPGLLFEDGTPARDAAAARAAELVTEIANVLVPAGAEAWTGPTLLVAGTDPVFIFARQTYLSDVLTALGATNASDKVGWVELSFEDVIRLNPGAIIFVRERPKRDAASEPRPSGSGEREQARDAEAALGRLSTLPIDAVTNNRLAVLENADAMMPSSGVIGVAEDLRNVLIKLGDAGDAE